MGDESPNDQPLSGAAKAALVCGAGATILLYYLFAIFSVLCLLVLVMLEFAVVIVALRFGAARFVLPIFQQHMALLTVFFRTFRLRKGAEFRLLLQPADAPGLFAILNHLAQQLEIAPPKIVRLEMSVNAWVRLKGLRRGAGGTTLGVGYDLLAGMTQDEVEGVMAHEMAHAKLIQRGLKNWLARGHARVANLTRALSAQVEAYRRAKRSADVEVAFLGVADWLTRLAGRLVAAHSRQDEFEADRGAAELCGSVPIRSALSKLDGLSRAAARLPWRERVAQLQLAEGFSQWLVKELASGASLPSESTPVLFDKYSTHPLLRDRLAALPPAPEGAPRDSRPAIQLLADPNEVAEKLVAEIQRVSAEQEEKDSKKLRRWTRRSSGSMNVRPVQLLGFIVSIVGGFGVLIGCFSARGPAAFSPEFAAIFISALVLTGGIFIIRAGRYRNRVALPVPDFGVLKAAWQAKNPVKDFASAEKEIEPELRARMAAEKKRAKRGRMLAEESYAALGRCDYMRAHVAARLCREADKRSVEGALAFLVAAAALHQKQQYGWAFKIVRQTTGMSDDSTVWSAGWATLLMGDWAAAEAFLEQAAKARPNEPTLFALLAISQWRRGKLQSAIASARRACEPQARNKEYTKLLAEVLLDAGHARAAREALAALETEARADKEIMFCMVRAKLMERDLAGAGEWTELLAGNPSEPLPAQLLVRLGQAYEAARSHDKAGGFYAKALAAGHYPEAHLGLGRLAAEQKHKERAQQLFLAALNTKQSVGEGGAGPLPLFQQIIAQLLMLEEPALNCRAWIARLAANASPPALANHSLMIYAADREQAGQYLAAITQAMLPDTPPILASIHWEEAPKPQQPDGPRRPGVQGVIG